MKYAIAVPRKYFLQVALSRTVYIEGPRNANDVPALWYEKIPGINAVPVRLPNQCRVTIEEGSPLNNQLWWQSVPIVSNKTFGRILEAG